MLACLGAKGFITSEVMKKEFASPSENVKVLVCGPPPQVAAVAGKKDGMKQGALGGALKELGYTEEQVRLITAINPSMLLIQMRRCTSSRI